MDEDDMLQNSNIGLDVPDSYKKPSPYELLMRQSRKMGEAATRTYDVARQFLTSDVRRLSPDKVVFGQRQDTPQKTSAVQRNDVRTIARRSHEILAAARTFVLPNNLFPDTIILDRTKLTIIKRTFFWSSQTVTIRIEDILHVSSSTGPFFGSINISSRIMNSTDHYEIEGFWRKDVIYLKEIIQGYMIAQHNHIDVDHLDQKELIRTLLELGRDSLL